MGSESKICIGDFRYHSPKFSKNQTESLELLAKLYTDFADAKDGKNPAQFAKLLGRVACREPELQTRHSYIPDFFTSERQILHTQELATAQERNEIFNKVVLQALPALFPDPEKIHTLLHVTCTGSVSPSAAQLFLSRHQPKAKVRHSYHMGCGGAFPASEWAAALAMADSNCVDVVHSELCTLHFDPRNPSLEKMVIHSLFSDGIIAYRVGSALPTPCFEIEKTFEAQIPDTDSAMTWMTSDRGYLMTLSQSVPDKIAQNLIALFDTWKISSNAIQWWAVHPGGPKILSTVENLLQLRPEQIQFSKKIFREHGNMSSATVPCIWQEMLKSDQTKNGDQVLSIGFGPGLTVYANLLRVKK